MLIRSSFLVRNPLTTKNYPPKISTVMILRNLQHIAFDLFLCIPRILEITAK